jgi:hypothetical protein
MNTFSASLAGFFTEPIGNAPATISAPARLLN